MTKLSKKSGQIAKKFEKFAHKTSEKSKEHIKSNVFGRFRHVLEVRLLIFEWLLLVSAIIFLAIIQSIWYQNSYRTSVFVDGGSYSEATFGDIKSLNPLFATTSSEKTAARLLFAPLFSVDTAGYLENHLASSISHDESGKIWTVKLRENLKWSDGHPLTTEDVIYTFSTINDPSVRSIYSDSFSTTTVQKVDDSTVTFALPTIFVDFPATLTVPILPAHILAEVPAALLAEHTFSLNPVTSGPFNFDYLQQSGTSQTLILAKNTKYFRGEPMLSRFIIQTYPTQSAIESAVRSHEVSATAALDYSFDSTPTDIYQKNASVNRGGFAFLNIQSSTLSDVRLRRAIRLALDQPEIRSTLGISLPLDYPILATQVDLTFPSLPEPNSTTALELLSSAGFSQQTTEGGDTLLMKDDSPVELVVATIDTGYLSDYAGQIADKLSALGFSVTLNVLEPTESQIFFSSIVQPRAYDILLYEVDLGIAPDLFPYYHSSQATSSGYNFSNYTDRISSDLILSARNNFDTELRRSKYESFLRHWVDDVPAIGLYQSELTYYYNRSTRPFSENTALVSPLDRFSDILYWASEKSPRFRTP